MIIEGKANIPVIRRDDLCIVEPIERLYQTDEGLVARALVRANDKIPLKIINLGDETKKIYLGTHIADLSLVSTVHKVKTEKEEAETILQIPDHLKDLFQRTVDGLSADQRDKVAKLLIKHQATFSESDADLGRTGVTRHKIPTGNASPIKKPLRRLPVHMNEEAEKQIEDMLRIDVIKPSSSPWASGIVMVQKKDGT